MIPVPTRTATLVSKIETTMGTAISLANSDAGFRARNPRVRPIGNAAMIAAATGNADIGAVMGQYSAQLTFDMELYNGGWKDIFLPACGFVGQTGGIYKFTDTYTSWKSITAGCFYSTLKKFGVYGAMGSFTLRLPAGQPGTISFNFKGVHTANPGTLPTNITFDTTLPPVFAKAGAFTLFSDTTTPAANVEITSDDYAVLIPSPNVAGAVLHAWLKKPNFRMRVDPIHKTGTGVTDWFANAIACTSGTFEAILDGGTGNKITVSGTGVQARTPEHQELDEMLQAGLELGILNNSLQLKFE